MTEKAGEDGALTPPFDSNDRSDAAREHYFGLSRDVRFDEAAEAALAASNTNPDVEQSVGRLLAEYKVHVNPRATPKAASLRGLTEGDWQCIRESAHPLLTLWSAANYRDKEGFYRAGPHDVDLRGSMQSQALLASLPLIHGTSVEGFRKLVQNGHMQSNKERYRQSNQDAQTFKDDNAGMTNRTDRELGLDQYVFFDFGRPSSHHMRQAPVTLVVDPRVMYEGSTFMTDKDIADTRNMGDVAAYLQGLTTPEYFQDQALLVIPNLRGSDGHRLSLSAWHSGQDGSYFATAQGDPQFSTYEVKKRSPPGVPADAIPRVIVRDEADYVRLKEELGDQFDFIHASLRPAGGIKQGYEGDPRDAAAFDRGNYGELLKIPGLYEKNLEKEIDADYQHRAALLNNLPPEEKEEVLAIFKVDPAVIDDPDIKIRISEKTDPRQAEAIYTSMDEVRDDYQTSDSIDQPYTTAHGHQPWFHRPWEFEKAIQTRTGTCIIATVERSKKDPAVSKILTLRKFSLDELAGETGAL